MTALVRAELLKLLTRTVAGLLLASLALVALTVVVSVPHASDPSPPVSLQAQGILAGVVGVGFGVPEVFVVLLGGIAMTQEFRYGTATSTYLGEPRRGRVLLAKWWALVLASVGVTVATLAVSVPAAAVVIRSRGGRAVVGTQLVETASAALLVMAAYAVIGVAAGALVRNQIAVVVGVLAWMLVVEQIVVPTYPVVGEWLPGGATYAWLQLAPALGLEGRLLPTFVAGCLLLAYLAAAATAALLVTPRRDVP